MSRARARRWLAQARDSTDAALLWLAMEPAGRWVNRKERRAQRGRGRTVARAVLWLALAAVSLGCCAVAASLVAFVLNV